MAGWLGWVQEAKVETQVRIHDAVVSLSSPVSYTEIDLLRGGERDLPAALAVLADYPFIAWSSQVQQQVRHHWGWGWEADDPLPTIGLPLEYPRIHPLDLAACYRRAYERNHWDERLQLAGR